MILQHYTTLARSLTFFSFVFTVVCVRANVRIVRSIFTRKIGEGVGITIPPSIRTFGNKVVYRHTHSFSEYFTDSFVPFLYMFHFFCLYFFFFIEKVYEYLYRTLYASIDIFVFTFNRIRFISRRQKRHKMIYTNEAFELREKLILKYV